VVLDTRLERCITWQVLNNFSVCKWNQIIINLFLVMYGRISVISKSVTLIQHLSNEGLQKKDWLTTPRIIELKQLDLILI